MAGRRGRSTARPTPTRSPGSRCSQRLRSGLPIVSSMSAAAGRLSAAGARDRFAAVGLDHSPDMVALAQATSGVPVLEGRAEALPFADGEFTAVSCLVAFFFFDDPVRVLREIRRVLAPGAGGPRSSRRRPRQRGPLPPRTRLPLVATSTPMRSSKRCRLLQGSASRASRGPRSVLSCWSHGRCEQGPSSRPRRSGGRHPDEHGLDDAHVRRSRAGSRPSRSRRPWPSTARRSRRPRRAAPARASRAPPPSPSTRSSAVRLRSAARVVIPRRDAAPPSARPARAIVRVFALPPRRTPTTLPRPERSSVDRRELCSVSASSTFRRAVSSARLEPVALRLEPVADLRRLGVGGGLRGRVRARLELLAASRRAVSRGRARRSGGARASGCPSRGAGSRGRHRGRTTPRRAARRRARTSPPRAARSGSRARRSRRRSRRRGRGRSRAGRRALPTPGSCRARPSCRRSEGSPGRRGTPGAACRRRRRRPRRPTARQDRDSGRLVPARHRGGDGALVVGERGSGRGCCRLRRAAAAAGAVPPRPGQGLDLVLRQRPAEERHRPARREEHGLGAVRALEQELALLEPADRLVELLDVDAAGRASGGPRARASCRSRSGAGRRTSCPRSPSPCSRGRLGSASRRPFRPRTRAPASSASGSASSRAAPRSGARSRRPRRGRRARAARSCPDCSCIQVISRERTSVTTSCRSSSERWAR